MIFFIFRSAQISRAPELVGRMARMRTKSRNKAWSASGAISAAQHRHSTDTIRQCVHGPDFADDARCVAARTFEQTRRIGKGYGCRRENHHLRTIQEQ